MGEVINNSDMGFLTKRIETLVEEARQSVLNHVNTVMVRTYFEIGRAIVENE